MPIATQEPRTVRVFTITCDRHPTHTEKFEVEPDATASEFPGWVTVRHPDPDHSEALWFDTRSCMSAWFADYIRVLHGEGPRPPRRTKAEIQAERDAKADAQVKETMDQMKAPPQAEATADTEARSEEPPSELFAASDALKTSGKRR